MIIIENDTDWQVAIYYSKSLTNLNSFNQSILYGMTVVLVSQVATS